MARRSLATASDQTVLILGSGLVARPCVEFLSRTRPVTLISAEAGQAEKLISTLPVGSQTVTPIHMDASDAEIERLVSEHDLTISLLPAPMHPVAIKGGPCFNCNFNFVQTSWTYTHTKIRTGKRAMEVAAGTPWAVHTHSGKLVHGGLEVLL
jgi:saccharopine dehydrogenase-like NADP-dependent oxidoreductase